MDYDISGLYGYYRVSTHKQEIHGNSLERYRKSLEAFPIAKPRIYFDVESGDSMDREGFNLLIKALRDDPNASGVVTPSHDRLLRSVDIWLILRDVLLARQLVLINLSKGRSPIDIVSPEGRYIAVMDSALAERQKNINQQHAILGHAARRNDGKVCKAVFGYRVNDAGFLEPNHDPFFSYGYSHWMAARQLVDTFSTQQSFSGTAEAASKLWPSLRGKRIYPSTSSGLRRWLLHESLRGYTVYFAYDPERKEVSGDRTHEALLTDSDWSTIQTRLKYPYAPRGPAHQLSQLVRCAHCDAIMMKEVSRSKGNEYHYLRCSGAFPRPGNEQICHERIRHPYYRIETKVIEAIAERASDVASWRAAQEKVNPNTAEIQKISAAIAQLEKLADPDLAGAIAKKKKDLARVKQQSQSSAAMDPKAWANYQRLAADKDFWACGKPEEKAALFRIFVEVAEVSWDGNTSVFFKEDW